MFFDSISYNLNHKEIFKLGLRLYSCGLVLGSLCKVSHTISILLTMTLADMYE